MSVTHKDDWEAEKEGEEVDEFPFVVGAVPKTTPPKAPQGAQTEDVTAPAAPAVANKNDDDDVVLVLDDDEENEDKKLMGEKKRPLEENGQMEPSTKKQKVEESGPDVIEIE